MVALGGFAAPVPARTGGTRVVIGRVITATAATFLLVEVFAICCGGLILAAGGLFGLPPWLTFALEAPVAVGTVLLAIVLFVRVYRVETWLLHGGDVPDLGRPGGVSPPAS